MAVSGGRMCIYLSSIADFDCMIWQCDCWVPVLKKEPPSHPSLILLDLEQNMTFSVMLHIAGSFVSLLNATAALLEMSTRSHCVFFLFFFFNPHKQETQHNQQNVPRNPICCLQLNLGTILLMEHVLSLFFSLVFILTFWWTFAFCYWITGLNRILDIFEIC